MALNCHFAPTPKKLSYTRSGSIAVVSVTALAGVSGFVRNAFGENVLSRANEAAMLDIEAIEDQDCFIPHVTLSAFINATARHSGEETLGLLLAPHLSIASKGCWGQYIIQASTLGAAIKRGIATIGFHSAGDSWTLVNHNRIARLGFASPPAKGNKGYSHVACGTAAIMLSLCRAFLPDRWRPRHVELDIPRPRRVTEFEDTFQCPVVFDAPDVAISFEAKLLDARHKGPPPRRLITPADLARARLECARLDRLSDILTQQVWSQVLTGTLSIESAACSLDISVRTLQRELKREGTDFRTIANTMRAKRAVELLLETDTSVTDISASLGYSDLPHFVRAFRNATGMRPKEFRDINSLAVSS